MRISLPYEHSKLKIELPDHHKLSVIEPESIPGLVQPRLALQEALQNPIASPPLSNLVRSDERVGIIFNGITRATLSGLILTEVLAELSHVPKSHITLFNATGTHRSNTEVELRSMLGDQLVDEYNIIQNDAFDATTANLLEQFGAQARICVLPEGTQTIPHIEKNETR